MFSALTIGLLSFFFFCYKRCPFHSSTHTHICSFDSRCSFMFVVLPFLLFSAHFIWPKVGVSYFIYLYISMYTFLSVYVFEMCLEMCREFSKNWYGRRMLVKLSTKPLWRNSEVVSMLSLFHSSSHSVPFKSTNTHTHTHIIFWFGPYSIIRFPFIILYLKGYNTKSESNRPQYCLRIDHIVKWCECFAMCAHLSVCVCKRYVLSCCFILSVFYIEGIKSSKTPAHERQHQM